MNTVYECTDELLTGDGSIDNFLSHSHESAEASTSSPSDLSPILPNVERYPRFSLPPHCVVCGDTTSGYNYEVPSCNGCKTFFRRTIVTKRTYTCKFGGNCFNKLPNKEKRNMCRECRFKKCVDVGMNPRILQAAGIDFSNEIFAAIMKRRIAEKKTSTSSKSNHSEPVLVLALPLKTVDNDLSALLYELICVDAKVEKFRRSSYNPNWVDIPSLPRLLEGTSALDIANRVGPMENWPLRKDQWPKDYHSLQACNPNSPLYPTYDPKKKHWMIFDLLVTIEYAKTFPFFASLSNSDKIILMRACGLSCVNLMQSFFSYSVKSDIVVNPDGTRLTPNPDYCNYLNSVLTCKQALIEPFIRNRISQKEYVLLSAILLCNAGTLDLSPHGMAVVMKEQRRLTKTLFDVCNMEHGSGGPSRFASILAIANVVQRLVHVQKDFLILARIQHPSNQIRIPMIEDMLGNYS